MYIQAIRGFFGSCMEVMSPRSKNNHPKREGKHPTHTPQLLTFAKHFSLYAMCKHNALHNGVTHFHATVQAA